MIASAVDPPTVVAGVAERFGIEAVRVRRFGTDVGDLDVDFDVPRPLAVTRILAGCTGSDADAWWRMPVHARIVAVVALGELIGPRIEIRVTCSCGEIASVPITAAELAEFERERTGARELIDVDGLRVRFPTGRDQLAWLGADPHSSGDLVRDVLSRLVVDEVELTLAQLVAVERALADADPLVDFRLETSCPACGAALATEVDLEALALHRLRRARREVVEQVDVLARAYHWSEDQIMRLPAWRRLEYVALAERVPG